jgi:glycosyltransferase involved in cell wall biosynthesis
MKVLLVPSWYLTDENPTLGSFFKEQAHAILNEGVDIRVAYTELRNPKFILKDVINKKKIGFTSSIDNELKTYRHIQYNIPPRISRSMEIRFYFGIKKILSRLQIEGWTPDLIHIHSFFPAGYGVLKLHKKYNYPYILTEHSTGFSKLTYKKYQLDYLTEILQRSNRIIAVGNGLKHDLERYTNVDIEVIPNMVDCDFFQREVEVSNEQFIFFSLGYLTHKKGFDILLRAFAMSFKGKRDVLLKIGGDGEERDNLIKLCKELKIDLQVEFLGSLSRTEVATEMNKCNSFLLASRFETFGVVFIEALACGKPIIVPSIEGPKEIVTSENGLIFESGNVIDLKDKMKIMYNDSEKYNAKKIMLTCNHKYNKSVIANKLIEIYNECKYEH